MMTWLPLFVGAVMATSDSLRPLSFDEVYRRVLAHHPVARQARLLEGAAEGQLRAARGAFDPVVSASWDRKDFGATKYYDYLSSSLKIPTWLGVDVKVGFERAQGAYIAPDRRTPGNGLLTAGINVPIGQGMLTDERRTAVAQARAMREFAAADRVALVNKLLYTAAGIYGTWYEAWRRNDLAREALALAEFRLEAVQRRVAAGDAAAIDTVEASVEVQRRRVLRAEADLAWRNASLQVEALLWNDRGDPEPLDSRVIPAPVEAAAPGDPDTVRAWIAEAERRHPDLRKASARREEAAAARALAAQRAFVPAASVGVSTLERAGSSTLSNPLGLQDDRKLEAEVSIPLFYRKERGRLEASDAALERASLDRALVRRGLAVAITSVANTIETLRELLALQSATVAQARALRDGEQRKFEAGESTLFLVNTRERAVIDEELKRIALEAKLVSARAELAVAIGEPPG